MVGVGVEASGAAGGCLDVRAVWPAMVLTNCNLWGGGGRRLWWVGLGHVEGERGASDSPAILTTTNLCLGVPILGVAIPEAAVHLSVPNVRTIHQRAAELLHEARYEARPVLLAAAAAVATSILRLRLHLLLEALQRVVGHGR